MLENNPTGLERAEIERVIGNQEMPSLTKRTR